MQKTSAKTLNTQRRPLVAVLQDSTALSLGVLLLATALLLLPVWWFGLPVNSHDTKAHASWQYYFSMQLWDGDLYPRWLAGMNEGFGSPSFYIYPPLSQYAAAVIAPLSDSAAWVYQRLGIAAAAAFFIGGAGTYFWLLKVTQDRISALMGSLVFLLAPYHLLTDTYLRAAYAELWAFAWAPFTLLAIHWFRENLNQALILYTGATAALFLSHAPSCIALLPAYVAYAALLSMVYREMRILGWTLVATLLAAMLAGPYLGTALTHQQYINSASLFSGYYNFSRWFLFSGTRWPAAGIEWTIAGTTLIQCGAIALFSFIVIQRSGQNRLRQALVWLSLSVSFAILFLVSAWSAPIWGIIPVVQKIQFPWRLLTAQTVFLALTCALYVKSVRSGPTGSRADLSERLMGPFLFLLVVINAGLIFYAKPEFIHSSPLRVRDAPEYHLGSINESNNLFKKGETARVIAGEGRVQVEVLAPRHIRMQVDAESELTFVLRHHYYPEWHCTSLGKSADCHVARFTARVPLISVTTGPGSKHITLQLSSAGERMGYLASIAGLSLLIGLCLLNHFFGRRGSRDSAALAKIASRDR